MNITQQVCTLAQAQALKELGVTQESQFWHYQDRTPTNPNMQYYDYPQESMPWEISLTGRPSRVSTSDVFCEYAAFSASELMELLPEGFRAVRCCNSSNPYLSANANNTLVVFNATLARSLADALVVVLRTTRNGLGHMHPSVDRHTRPISDGDRLMVQNIQEPVAVYTKDDGYLYFKPYGPEERVNTFFSKDLTIV